MALRGKFFGTLYRWHRWIGLMLVIPLVVLILTGSLLVFREELEALVPLSEKHTETQVGKEMSLQQMLDAAQLKYPGDHPVALSFDDHNPNRVTVRIGVDGSKKFSGSHRVYFDRHLGLVDKKSDDKGFWDFTLRLHREYLLGFYGKLLVGFLGLLFIFSLLSGFYLYGPTTLKLSYGWIRRGKTSWTWADVHKLVGITSFSWMLLMGVSGLLLAISGQLLQIYQYTELKALSAEYGERSLSSDPVSLDAAVKAVMSAKPQSEMSFITFPESEYSTPLHYIFVMNGTEAWNKYLSELVLVDASTGRVAEERPLPWYLKAAVLSEPLHFGNYGGLTLKGVWMSFGIFGLILSVSGPLLYFRKKRADSLVKGFPSSKLRNPSLRSPYTIPALIIALIFLSSLTALFVEQGLDILAALVAAMPLIYLTRRIIRALRLKKA
jgi:uncharacterized iron-regulated membrane protein